MSASAQSLEAASAGDVLSCTTEVVSRADLRVYADASGDQNPIHQDEAAARSVGLPNVIAHGMLTMGLVGSQLEAVADGRPMLSYGTRFASPVVVSQAHPSEITIEISLLSRDLGQRTATLEAAVSVEGTKVLTRTRAVIQLD